MLGNEEDKGGEALCAMLILERDFLRPADLASAPGFRGRSDIPSQGRGGRARPESPALRERAIANQIGKHNGGEFALFGRAAHFRSEITVGFAFRQACARTLAAASPRSARIFWKRESLRTGS